MTIFDTLSHISAIYRTMGVFAVCVLLGTAAEAQGVREIHVQQLSHLDWQVTYELEFPVSKLVFLRNPDDSRLKEWKTVSDEFQLLRNESGIDYLSRIDGNPFQDVSISLPAQYRYIPGEYAPFSPFSNGDLLIHTGRLFSCAKECIDSAHRWPMSLDSAILNFALVKGRVSELPASWIGEGDGQQLYIGNSIPEVSSHFISIIDPGLPNLLSNTLFELMPRMFETLADTYGDLKSKPVILASYGRTSGANFGNQGGVLQNQISMHWYGNKLEELVADKAYIYDMSWFFAHEAVHLFQAHNLHEFENSYAWIHEGLAEYLASQLLLSTFPESQGFVYERKQAASKDCEKGLESFSLNPKRANYKFELQYSCGFWLHILLSQVLGESDNQLAVSDIWLSYENRIAQGSTPGPSLYLDTIRQFVGPQQFKYFLEITEISSLTGTQRAN